ncbi:hypothetical protein BC833DRAFT_607808 [Globomyces pollinis-pini]|nr:hypothetical protein BC833DRAFT_607808 [Globomyces pollinis-pini]
MLQEFLPWRTILLFLWTRKNSTHTMISNFSLELHLYIRLLPIQWLPNCLNITIY